MEIRFLGHSCVEIVGKHHILIDPDFTRDPLPDVEYICISHAHRDHIGRVAEVPGGIVLASKDVCEIAAKLGVPRERLRPVQPGDQMMNIHILSGYSSRNGLVYRIFVLLFKHRMPEPSGTPLAFLVKDEALLLHNGDACEEPRDVQPDILCLPWRIIPYQSEQYKEALIQMVSRLHPRYILPIHYDLTGTEGDLDELSHRVKTTCLSGNKWYAFEGKELVNQGDQLDSDPQVINQPGI